MFNNRLSEGHDVRRTLTIISIFVIPSALATTATSIGLVRGTWEASLNHYGYTSIFHAKPII